MKRRDADIDAEFDLRVKFDSLSFFNVGESETAEGAEKGEVGTFAVRKLPRSGSARECHTEL